MAMMNDYVDGAANGQAPMGPQPMGQKAGTEWPGNGQLSIDRANPNPSDRAQRVGALLATRMGADLKRNAGFELLNRLGGQ